MQRGLHETVLTSGLERQLSREVALTPGYGAVDDADQSHVLLRHLDGVLGRRLEDIRDPVKRLAFANQILRSIDEADDSVLEPTRELQSMLSPAVPGAIPRYGQRPRTPLNDPALLTNAHGEPSLASELRAELDSADQVDLLCAFVMWRGVRLPSNAS